MDTIHTLHYKSIILLYTNDNCFGPTPQQLKPITVGPFNDKYLETAVNNIVQTSTTFIVLNTDFHVLASSASKQLCRAFE
jgi:hypothetical protein